MTKALGYFHNVLEKDVVNFIKSIIALVILNAVSTPTVFAQSYFRGDALSCSGIGSQVCGVFTGNSAAGSMAPGAIFG